MLILVAFTWICLYSMKFAGLKNFNHDYISIESTTAIKGIFVLMVFISHFAQYHDFPANSADAFNSLRFFFGQLTVVMFFFYSGYGIFESVKRKGTDYIKSFPKNRFLKILLHLDMAMLIYLAVGLLTGRELTVPQVLLSLIGWTSIGNSNWFMFAILALYLIVFIAFMISRKSKLFAVILTTLLTFVYIAVMMRFKDNYWYNSVLCLPLGMWYSFFREKAEKLLLNNIAYYITLAVIVAGFVVADYYRLNSIVYEVRVLLFTLLVVVISMKVRFGNKALLRLGNHVFSIYIFQRLPMSLLSQIDAIYSNIYLYFALSLICTVIISGLFDALTGLIDKKLFPKGKKVVHSTM